MKAEQKRIEVLKEIKQKVEGITFDKSEELSVAVKNNFLALINKSLRDLNKNPSALLNDLSNLLDHLIKIIFHSRENEKYRNLVNSLVKSNELSQLQQNKMACGFCAIQNYVGFVRDLVTCSKFTAYYSDHLKESGDTFMSLYLK